MQVSNPVDPVKQQLLRQTHGEDGTYLLRRRADGRSALSSNIGGKALRSVVKLLDGDVGLRFMPDATLLRMEVHAARARKASLSETLVVYFLDDEATMRRRYQAWISPPLDPASRVFPQLKSGPAEADAAVLAFPQTVLSASPCPRAVLLDQNLKSQVNKFENVTLGTEIAKQLREAGYDGTIVIRSANVSRKVMQEYLAAGADAVMSKDEQRDSLLNCLARGKPAPASHQDSLAADSLAKAPILDTTDFVWTEMDAQARTEIVEEFREQVTRTVVNIKELLETSTIHALPGELHQLVGQARAIGALKLQAYATRCKSCFTEENLQGVEALLYETLAAMQSANAAAPALSSAADSPFAQPADGPPLVCVGIDDCQSLQQVHKCLFEQILKADMGRCVVGGSTAEQQDAFVDVALGRLDSRHQNVPFKHQRHADIAVLDQNIRLDDEVRVLGTELATRLKQNNFQGVCAILTGSSVHSEHFNSLRSMPGVDLVLEKGMPLPDVARELRRALAAKRLERGQDLSPNDIPPGQQPVPGAALASDASYLLQTSFPVANELNTPLIDLSHMDGLRPEAKHRILVAAFTNDAPHSIAGNLRRLQATFFKLGQPAEMVLTGALFKQCHSLVGTAASCGASELCRQVRIFEAAPAAEGFDVLWRTLSATHAELITRGLLQRPALSPTPGRGIRTASLSTD